MFGSAYKDKIRDVDPFVVFRPEAMVPFGRWFTAPAFCACIAAALSQCGAVTWRDVWLPAASPTSRLERTRTGHDRRTGGTLRRLVSSWQSSGYDYTHHATLGTMSGVRLLATIAVFSVLASAAELHGSWSASSSNGRTFAGTWTADAHPQTGGVTGAWTLRDSASKILMSGAWSASKSPQAWNGAWRAK